ncbi:hypothetical protein MRX96_001136 [Rhipicephalus microplus]
MNSNCRTKARDVREGGSKGKIVQAEKDVSTKSAVDVLMTSLKMCGWRLWPGVLCFAVSAVTTSWQLVWIREWTDANGPNNAANPYDSRWIYGLVCLSLAAVVSRLAGNVLLSFAMNRLSRVLHHKMLERVLFSPVSFFDSTPRGRILNRFTADLSGVDNRMAALSRQMVQNSLVALSRLAVIGTESIPVIVVGLMVIVIFVTGMIPMTMATLCVTFIGMTQIMVALERDIEYTELPKEADVEYTTATEDAAEQKMNTSAAEVHRVDKTWPSEGRIDFEDFSASYRPSVLNDSLRHVTFTVSAREKVDARLEVEELWLTPV